MEAHLRNHALWPCAGSTPSCGFGSQSFSCKALGAKLEAATLGGLRATADAKPKLRTIAKSTPWLAAECKFNEQAYPFHLVQIRARCGSSKW